MSNNISSWANDRNLRNDSFLLMWCICTHKFYLKQFKLSILTEAEPRSDVLLLLIHSFHMCVNLNKKHLCFCFIVVLTHYTLPVVNMYLRLQWKQIRNSFVFISRSNWLAQWDWIFLLQFNSANLYTTTIYLERLMSAL